MILNGGLREADHILIQRETSCVVGSNCCYPHPVMSFEHCADYNWGSAHVIVAATAWAAIHDVGRPEFCPDSLGPGADAECPG